MQKTERIERFKAWFQSTNDHPGWRNWRKHSKEARSFYDGDQHSAKDIAELEERGQPAITVNKIFAKINNLKGAQRLVRRRVGARPRTTKDIKAAESISDLFRYIDYRADYGQEESLAFDDGIIEGIGWLEAYVKEDELGQLEVDIDNEEPQRIRIDPLSRRYDLSDARFITRDKWVDLDEALELFPEKATILKSFVETTDFSSPNVVQHGPLDDYDMVEPTGAVTYIDPLRKRVRLVEIWYREFQDVLWKDGKYIEKLPPSFYNKSEQMAQDGISKARQRVVRLAVFCGDVELSDTITPYNNKLNINHFPFIPFFCFRKKTGEPYGYVHQGVDVQREINKRRSKAMHILNTAQIIADSNAVEDIEDLREEAARPDGILLKRQGTELTIERNLNLAQSQFHIMNQSSADLQDIMGVYDEAIGKSTNARSGVAIAERKQSSNQNNLIVLDNLRRTRLLLWRFILGLVKQFYTEEQIILVTDETTGASKQVELNGPDTELASALVDIVIDELEPNPSAQEEQFMYLVEAAKSGLPIPPDVIIEASSLRNKEEILKRMRQNTQSALPAQEGVPAAAEGVPQ